MLGGVQAVTWTDVKQMVVIVAGVAGRGVRARPAAAGRRQRRRRAAHRRRHRPAAGDRLPLHADRDLHVLVGPHRRAVPDAVVLRLRSEPGAALSHGEVGRGRAAVADDERLREDPAAGAHPAHRRARLHVLPVHAAADAVQPAARAGGARQQSRRGTYAGARGRFKAGIRRAAATRPRRWRRHGGAATPRRSRRARDAFKAARRRRSTACGERQ